MNRRNFLITGGSGLASLSLAGFVPSLLSVPGRGRNRYVYIGTYTTSPDEGIGRCRMDLSDGMLHEFPACRDVLNPSFLIADPKGRCLYAVNETGDYGGMKSGSVSSFSISQPSGELVWLNTKPSLGAHPCHLTISRNGRYILVANYTGGNVTVLPVLADGSLGDPVDCWQHEGHGLDPQRQEGPHVHSVNLSPDNRFAYVCDLGIDRIRIYRFNDQTGRLQASGVLDYQTVPGAGPRHLDFSPHPEEAFVINELNSTLTWLEVNSGNGALREKYTVSTLPDFFGPGNTCADVHVHPEGKFVYGSNRGNDSIAVFKIDRKSGILKLVQHQSTLGQTPRSFAIDASGRYLLAANQQSDSIQVFTLDNKTGLLTAMNHSLAISRPVCIRFL